MTATHPSADPWAVPPRSTTYSTPPAGFPATADPFAAPPPAALPATRPFPVPAGDQIPAAHQYSTPLPAQHSVPPHQYSAPPTPYSAPPVQYSAPPSPYSAPPDQYPVPPDAGRLGPHPPLMAPPPGGAPQYGTPSAVAVQIGEIMVTPPEIRTPAGVLPLAGAQWHVADYWQKEEKIAPWAIVCAILGFFCLTIFSLLFLLIKETRHQGTVQVTVTSGHRQYVARIPVTDQSQVMHVNNQVNYARSLSMR
ncbi:hypothetical protein GVV04_04535 [Micromonospora sp. NEAU-HG-1]|nr:hypothetical protein [Micromonospora rubida]